MDTLAKVSANMKKAKHMCSRQKKKKKTIATGARYSFDRTFIVVPSQPGSRYVAEMVCVEPTTDKREQCAQCRTVLCNYQRFPYHSREQDFVPATVKATLNLLLQTKFEIMHFDLLHTERGGKREEKETKRGQIRSTKKERKKKERVFVSLRSYIQF